MKHTPGPWSANQSELSAHSPRVEVRAFDDAYTICTDCNWQNASLIAAAPEMLAALQAVLPYVNAGEAILVRAALAKATS